MRNVISSADVVRSGAVVACVPVACTFGTRLRGLMGRSSLGEGEGLLLVDCPQVHTCFMRFPIDVLYLGSDMRGIEVETLTPWRLGGRVEGARHVLEMPAGFFDGIEPGSIRVNGAGKPEN